jgi:tRNA A37 threonylcarbamoyladenosine biosynthesis protein TsaE
VRVQNSKQKFAKMFDEDQQVAFNLSNGHNFILSGQAGTGTTFLIKHIVQDQQNG